MDLGENGSFIEELGEDDDQYDDEEEEAVAPTTQEVAVDIEKLQGILEMFRKASSDEERFAILLLVAKTTPPGDSDAMQLVYDAVGLKFLSRLLSTKGEGDGELTMFQNFGLTLLSSFSSLPEVAADPIYLSHADLLVDIVQHQPSQTAVFQEALKSIAGSLVTPEGRNVYRRYKLTKILTKILQNDIRSKASPKDAPSTSSAPDQAVTTRILLSTITLSIRGDGDIVCPLSQLHHTISVFAECFATKEDMSKFEGCANLARCIDYLNHRGERITNATAVNHIRRGLRKVLSSRLSEEFRGYAIHLAAAMITNCEGKLCPWALLVESDVVQNTVEEKDKEGRDKEEAVTHVPTLLIQLLTQLACVEIRIAIEYKSLSQVLSGETTEALSNCFVVTESALAFMTQTPDDVTSIHQRLNTAILGAFTAIMSLISGIRANLKSEDISEDRDKIDCSDQTVMTNALNMLRASIRLLGVWLAEDLPDNRDDLINIIPFILDQSNESSAYSKEMIQFMLPAYCHLSAEADILEVLLQHDLPTILIRFLQTVLTLDGSPCSVEDIQGACSVFLNMIVANPSELVKENDTFTHLAVLLVDFCARRGDPSTKSAASSPSEQTMLDHVVTVTMFLHHKGVCTKFSKVHQTTFAQWAAELISRGLRTVMTPDNEVDDDVANQHSLWQLCLSVTSSSDFRGDLVYTSLNSDQFVECCARVIAGNTQRCVRERATLMSLAKRIANAVDAPCDGLLKILGRSGK